MKTLCSILVAFLLTGLEANAQITGYALDEDPVFTATVAQHLHYPATAIRGSVYGRFYVKFSIDSTGSLQNIAVLYPQISPKIAKSLGFEYELINSLRQVPRLTSRYRGSYILPVAFVYINYNEDSKPRVPTNTLPEKYLDNSLILNEVKVVGRSDMYRSLRPLSGNAPASRQVVLF
ncbi:energy transducer TonB [Spirosoma fluviale]|uniref:TonB protein C-terminal n=1 Tax=Spirosoma fluviale TaxID=1597977 RepID=A0A286GKI2_9BACT|nr:hypothetical protein [Spirosoma fluviale]SOD95494.1 TonB protein C-terminal [Spirosoma fluviale]